MLGVLKVILEGSADCIFNYLHIRSIRTATVNRLYCDNPFKQIVHLGLVRLSSAAPVDCVSRPYDIWPSLNSARSQMHLKAHFTNKQSILKGISASRNKQIVGNSNCRA